MPLGAQIRLGEVNVESHFFVRLHMCLIGARKARSTHVQKVTECEGGEAEEV